LFIINAVIPFFRSKYLSFSYASPSRIIEKNVLVELEPSVSNAPIFNFEKEEFDSLELTISNTDIKIPIVQGVDNSYYLNHLSNGDESKLGTPFLDYRNHLNDQKLLIYGHNSKTIATEFHILEKYLNPSFLKEHSMIFLKGKKISYQYKIFSVLIVTDDFQHMKINMSPEEYQKHIRWLKKQSVFDTFVDVYDYDDILILQTCYYNPKDSYLLIASKKVK